MRHYNLPQKHAELCTYITIYPVGVSATRSFAHWPNYLKLPKVMHNSEFTMTIDELVSNLFC